MCENFELKLKRNIVFKKFYSKIKLEKYTGLLGKFKKIVSFNII